MSNGFNTFKMNDSIHVQILLIIQEMWKKSLTYSSINVKYKLLCVFHINKCNMQHLNNGFNKFKMDETTCLKMLIVQEMWKISLNHSNIITKHWVTCVSIHSNKYKI
jgi:hypothetical protein